MSKRKQKKGRFDLFGFDEEDFFREPKSFSEGGSGYSISVTYDERGKPIVKVQTHGSVDVTELRRDIERRYPGARIEGLEGQPLIRIVDEKPASEKEEHKKEEAQKKKEKREKGTLNTNCQMIVERKKVPPEFQKPDTRSELKVVFTFIFDL